MKSLIRKYPILFSKDMYCDDLLASADFLKETKYISHTITEILKSGGFIFRKWISNKSDILDSLEKYDISNKILHFESNDYTKTLGLCYSPVAVISKIFDPLGFLGIFTITVKNFIQKLWLTKLNRDDGFNTRT